jgi:signal transduction histidine kinase
VVYLHTAGKSKSVALLESRIPDADLYLRSQFVTALARWTSVGFSLAALVLLWDNPRTKPVPAVVTAAVYLAYAAADALYRRRRPDRARAAKVVHDVVDALAVGAGAALSGGLDSPIWLLLYPHVAAVSVRGGLRYAMAMGLLDAGIVLVLNLFTENPLPGNLHAPALLFCAFMGGSTRSYLEQVKRRLGEANALLQRKNEELEATMARLADLDRLRQEYVRNVSHEFRTPLTVIRGYAGYLMEEGLPADTTLPEVMGVLVESCDQIIDMINTLLEVSRIEQGGTDVGLSIRTLDLGELALSSTEPLRRLADKKGIGLDLQFPGEPLTVQGDQELLQHVVRKLVDNALKYSRPGSRTIVRGRGEPEMVALEVQDFGIGIPAEHLPRIFEKFYRVDGALTRRSGGAGVGLYLAREVVRLHHGAIEVRSQVGEGSVFSVRLPRRFEARPPLAAPA